VINDWLLYVGVGAEWMFAPAWSAKLEYDYLGFGSNSCALGFVGTSVNKPGLSVRLAVAQD
jgi:opacity protein-like surface antigen